MVLIVVLAVAVFIGACVYLGRAAGQYIGNKIGAAVDAAAETQE